MVLSLLAARLRELEVGRPPDHDLLRQRGLDVFPLLGPDRPGLDYVLTEDALATGDLQVEEAGDAGVVAQLVVTNAGGLPILVLDGEVLAGAKQNRVVNASMLLAALSKTQVPVSCVERGRWRYEGRRTGSDHISPHRIRSSVRRSVSRSLKERRSYHSDQGEVWEQVDIALESVGSCSPSDDLVQAYDDRAADLVDLESLLRPDPDWQGFIVAVRGKITGGDLFDRAETLRKSWRKLLRAAALDAIGRPSSRERSRAESTGTPRADPRVDPLGVRRLLDRAAETRPASYPSPGLGVDLRVESGDLLASALVADDTLIHAGLFVAE